MNQELIKTNQSLEQENYELKDGFSSPSHSSQKRSDNNQMELGHSGVIDKVMERGAAPGLIDNSRDSKKVKIGEAVHETCQNVLNFLLTDVKVGIFRKITIQKRRNGSRIVFWQHFVKLNVYEYLLDLKIERSYHITKVKVATLEEDDIPREMLDAVLEAKRNLGRSQRPRRATLCGEILFFPYGNGQSVVTFVGDIEEGSNLGRTTNRSVTSASSAIGRYVSLRSNSLVGRSQIKSKPRFTDRSVGEGTIDTTEKVTFGLTAESTFASLKGIFEEIEKRFFKPDVIDKRIRQHFVRNVIPNAPALTIQEMTLFDGEDVLEEQLIKECVVYTLNIVLASVSFMKKRLSK